MTIQKLEEKSVLALIKTLNLTKPLSELPPHIQTLVEERIRKAVQVIENWLVKTFVSKGIFLSSGKRHGIQAMCLTTTSNNFKIMNAHRTWNNSIGPLVNEHIRKASNKGYTSAKFLILENNLI